MISRNWSYGESPIGLTGDRGLEAVKRLMTMDQTDCPRNRQPEDRIGRLLQFGQAFKGLTARLRGISTTGDGTGRFILRQEDIARQLGQEMLALQAIHDGAFDL